MGNRWKSTPPAERFERHFQKSDGCWEWTGLCTKDGYGKFFFDGKYRGAHRVSYLLVNGELPDSKCVLHRCDNPVCVRPDHLFLGTKLENNIDMRQKGRGWWQRPNPVGPRTPRTSKVEG